jgi:uncharacterized protein (DUF2237 family)
VNLEATHEKALDVVPIDYLNDHAIKSVTK